MKKSYLLAGSIGLLGMIAPGFSVVAAETPAAAQASEQLAAAEVLPQTDNSIAQVTSVSELSDVQPTDWAFQAVQSLVERYGCIEGYPDRTFRGNRAATRFELAAALNACLNAISERFVTAEDLATIRQLQDEFAAELATLRGRVDAVEARTAELEANQFSTTTKLQGEAVIAGQYGEGNAALPVPTPGGAVAVPVGGDARATAIGRVRLNFNTSFSGSDLLQTQLEAGNGGEDYFGNVLAPNGFGNLPIPDLGAVDYAGVGTDFNLRRLAYTFKVGENLAVTFGPRLFPSDFVDFNSYANNSAQDFSSGFFINNPLIINNVVDTAGGAGGAIDWNFGGGPLTVRAVYVAASPTNAIANELGGGLFGDPYQGTAEVEFAPSQNFALRAQYTNSATLNTKANVYGGNAELTFGRFGVFGRYAYADGEYYGGPAGNAFALPNGDFSAQTWMAGVGIRDLFVPGSLLAFAAGQPFINSLDGPEGSGINDANQTNYEAFYRFAVNDNITVTPVFMMITDANNSSASDTIYQGLLRTTFSF